VATAVAERAAPRARSLNGWLERPPATALLVTAAVMSTWPVTSVTPQPGLDPSWAIGLSLALSRGLAFGSRIVFTYGPLGLITAPRAVSPATLALGLLGAIALQVALVALVLRCTPAGEPLVIALIATVATVLIFAANLIGSQIDDIAFGAVALTLSSAPRSRRAATRLALAGGLLAGLALLVKLDDGIAATTIVAAGLLGLPQARRTLALAAGSLVATVLIAWLALGQPLTALPDYLRTGVAVVKGYVDAMGYDVIGADAHWIVLVVVASGLLLSAAAWHALAGAPRRARLALVAAVLLVHYFIGREVLVRFDPIHATALTLLVPVALMIPWRNRGTALAATCALAVAGLAALSISGIGVTQVFEPWTRASAFVDQVGTMLAPDGAIASSEAAIRGLRGLTPALAAELDGQCVDVEPTEVSLLFAYPQWRWCPAGTLQSYTAYTTSLDDLDARSFDDPRGGPDRVIRELDQTIDGRNPVWEPPAAMLALLCHFTEIGRAGSWQVLARTADRCGAPRTITTIASDGANPITLPAPTPGTVMLAEVHGLGLGTLERLGTLFGRAAIRTLTINGTEAYRVVPDTLGDGLILDVPANADYAAPFNLNMSAYRLSAAIAGQAVPFSVTLVGVPIRPFPASAG
jgi:hypothetical protein